MGFETADADSEYVRAATSDNAPNRLPSEAKLANDLLDRDAFACQFEDRIRSFLASLKAIPLPSFRFRQRRGINGGRGQDFPNGSHMLSHHVEESGACIFDEMPTISDLNGLWGAPGRRLAIAGTAISGDYIDPGIIPKPRSGSTALTVRKKGYDTASLQVANDGSVSASPPPRPIVNPNRTKWPIRTNGAASNRSQKRILADKDGEFFREIMSWPTAKCETEPMNDVLHPGGASCEWNRNAHIEPFDKNLPWAS